MASKNMDRALEAAKEYRKLVAFGDMVMADQLRQTIEELGVGSYVGGKYTLPTVVREAMGLEVQS